MERYFLGSNTARGFLSFYEEELKRKSKVVLLKGGPGTGKSSILKFLSKEAADKGYEVEEWYCSGDPNSLDGVYVKDTESVVMDATSPHAVGANLPVMRDVIIDLAKGLDKNILEANRAIIEKLLNDKKHRYMRAYQYLKCALCHYDNEIELEKQTFDVTGLCDFSLHIYDTLIRPKRAKESDNVKRNLFSRAICPSGESEYFDHLRDKEIISVKGNVYAKNIFFDNLCALSSSCTALATPLCPAHIEGLVFKDVALVSRVGHYAGNVSEEINLSVFSGKPDRDAIEYERNEQILKTAFAVEELNKARSAHTDAEKYFIAAMDFDRNAEIKKALSEEILSK